MEHGPKLPPPLLQKDALSLDQAAAGEEDASGLGCRSLCQLTPCCVSAALVLCVAH